MLAPAAGDLLIATGEVVKPGRTLSVVRAEVVALQGDRRTLVAMMQQTLMVMHGVADEKI
jgi:acyl-coenzyme A thioesterase PaaI-like protein